MKDEQVTRGVSLLIIHVCPRFMDTLCREDVPPSVKVGDKGSELLVYACSSKPFGGSRQVVGSGFFFFFYESNIKTAGSGFKIF